jgi:prolyl-tRNA synthetase
MRASNYYITTIKEIPNDAELPSHRLMLRSGMIRKLGSGLYTWLPLGLKVLKKIENIVREEMNAIGCLELLMPAVQPCELWQETKRWDTFGDLLLKIKDSNAREYCFGPTHEEVITDLVRQDLSSYKDLPRSFYQIQTKFRDEIRPRFGVMRAREFMMKDAYSFHTAAESLQHTYDLMYSAYCKIFTRIGLEFRAVEADTGAIGGAISHEFQVLADSGEDVIAYSDTSSYAANLEKAERLVKGMDNTPTPELQIVDTGNNYNCEDVAQFLNIPLETTVKTLLVKGATHPVIALVLRGNDTLNTIKAEKHPLIAKPLSLIDAKDTDLPIGNIGPLSLEIPIIIDPAALAIPQAVCGANLKNQHYTNVVWQRDLPAAFKNTQKELSYSAQLTSSRAQLTSSRAQLTSSRALCAGSMDPADEPRDDGLFAIFDLCNVNEGDLSPDGQGKLKLCRGIEVGHIFQLGDKYSQAMQLNVLGPNGEKITPLMGCYGIGVSRLVAAAIEQHHTEAGINWPEAIAPFSVAIIPLNYHNKPEVKDFADDLYKKYLAQGFDVILDDRDSRPGVLFSEHDLLGIPHRFIISERNLNEHKIEYRHNGNTEFVSEDFMLK